MCVFYLNVQNFTKNMLTLDFLFYIILKYFVVRQWLAEAKLYQTVNLALWNGVGSSQAPTALTSLIISWIVDKFQLIHADIAQ